ncbi:4Fe-4S ferredoxin, iron-sulfur binding [Candidatus Hydrogenisulfobacillus filiaventi]|uniref:4Fe-4S ferredoxin, iron-sulfur binding n=1 Tax=Candidatus Hydrogenisulfobacillus filiaventi TaxID=2707344 RepID=A0A6F8ZH09_9FIRM|nr:4Fe-4S ferredoxin, iron-sulfur binding [Candidatus Hydrogenisulfobacillus filiaventi]
MAGAVLAAGAGGAAIHRRRRQRQVAAARRRAAAVLLEAIALYLAAGSGFWPAVEGAVAMAGDPGLREVARAVLAGEVPAPLPAEWEELVTWLGRGRRGAWRRRRPNGSWRRGAPARKRCRPVPLPAPRCGWPSFPPCSC